MRSCIAGAPLRAGAARMPRGCCCGGFGGFQLCRPAAPDVALILLQYLAYVRDISESVNAVEELQAALEKVKALFDIIPICMSCGDVRNDKGYWTRVEDFFAEHAGTQFSHGLCPDCLPRLYPECAAEMTQEERGKAQESSVRKGTPAGVD